MLNQSSSQEYEDLVAQTQQLDVDLRKIKPFPDEEEFEAVVNRSRQEAQLIDWKTVPPPNCNQGEQA